MITSQQIIAIEDIDYLDASIIKDDIVAVLMKSIERYGVIHMPVARPYMGRHQLLAGRHRVEAAKQLGWTEMLCDIHSDDMSEDDALQISIEENSTRRQWKKAELAEWIRLRNQDPNVVGETGTNVHVSKPAKGGRGATGGMRQAAREFLTMTGGDSKDKAAVEKTRKMLTRAFQEAVAREEAQLDGSDLGSDCGLEKLVEVDESSPGCVMEFNEELEAEEQLVEALVEPARSDNSLFAEMEIHATEFSPDFGDDEINIVQAFFDRRVERYGDAFIESLSKIVNAHYDRVDNQHVE